MTMKPSERTFEKLLRKSTASSHITKGELRRKQSYGTINSGQTRFRARVVQQSQVSAKQNNGSRIQIHRRLHSLRDVGRSAGKPPGILVRWITITDTLNNAISSIESSTLPRDTWVANLPILAYERIFPGSVARPEEIECYLTTCYVSPDDSNMSHIYELTKKSSDDGPLNIFMVHVAEGLPGATEIFGVLDKLEVDSEGIDDKMCTALLRITHFPPAAHALKDVLCARRLTKERPLAPDLCGLEIISIERSIRVLYACLLQLATFREPLPNVLPPNLLAGDAASEMLTKIRALVDNEPDNFMVLKASKLRLVPIDKRAPRLSVIAKVFTRKTKKHRCRVAVTWYSDDDGDVRDDSSETAKEQLAKQMARAMYPEYYEHERLFNHFLTEQGVQVLSEERNVQRMLWPEGETDPIGETEPAGETDTIGETEPTGETDTIGETDPTGGTHSAGVGDNDNLTTLRAEFEAASVKATAWQNETDTKLTQLLDVVQRLVPGSLQG